MWTDSGWPYSIGEGAAVETDIDWKQETRKQWNATPCGTGDHTAALEYGSLAFFDEVRRSRYEDSDPWIPRTIPFASGAGKRVLEIGHGLGSDLLSWRQHGAEVYGIDITDEHHQLCKRNFDLRGEPVDLRLCDAARIDHPDAYFDVVYSQGVLHHTPDIEACIAEIHRVLKPGGRFIMTVYHRRSAFYLVNLMLYTGLRKRELFRLGYRGLLATIERGADGIATKPLVNLYTKAEVRQLLRGFGYVEVETAHFNREHLPYFDRFLTPARSNWLERHAGWYVVSTAVK